MHKQTALKHLEFAMSDTQSAPGRHENSYAVKTARAIREDNAKAYDQGKFAKHEARTIDEMPRLQEMNQSLVHARNPGQTLEQDKRNAAGLNYTVPEPDDARIKAVFEQARREQQRMDQERG
jgi:hypothetical protein